MSSLPIALRAGFIMAFVAATSVPTFPVRAAETLSPAQKREVEEVVRETIRENPEIILDAIERLRAKQETGVQEKMRETLTERRAEIERQPGSPVGGNPDGDVTVVEFFDYRCGYCKRVHAVVMDLLKKDPKVRFVYKEFPILGPESVIASRAALSAFKVAPAKYAVYHDALMTMRGQVTEERILALAASIGLDPKAIVSGMRDVAVDSEIQKNAELAAALGINGTPGFIVGNAIAPGALDAETLRKLVAEARVAK